jgi:hypothetical protein
LTQSGASRHLVNRRSSDEVSHRRCLSKQYLL